MIDTFVIGLLLLIDAILLISQLVSSYCQAQRIDIWRDECERECERLNKRLDNVNWLAEYDNKKLNKRIDELSAMLYEKDKTEDA